MLLPSFQNLTKYIIDLASKSGFALTKTALIKLIYLIDVENYRYRGSILSGANWIFYKYGPYDQKLASTIDWLPRDPSVQCKKFEDENGLRGTLFLSVSEMDTAEFDFETKAIILGVVREWGGADLIDLLNHVYFYTEPMINAKKNDRLDFSCVGKVKSQKTVAVRLNADKLAEIHAKSEAMSKKFSQIKKMNHYIDFHAVESDHDDDQFGVKGIVTIDPSALDASDE